MKIKKCWSTKGYGQKIIDPNPDFRKVLNCINRFSGGKTYGSCQGHPPNFYKEGDKEINPTLNIKFNDEILMNKLLNLFLYNKFVIQYIVEVDSWFHRAHPGYKFGLVIHLKKEVGNQNKWSELLSLLESYYEVQK